MATPELYEWTAVAPDGTVTTYQTAGPDVPESSMLEHLRKHFRNLNITAIRRIRAGEYKPATGPVQRHAYDFGHLRAVRRELGLSTPENDGDAIDSVRRTIERDRLRQTIQRRPIVRSSILRK